jgi:hypothetical protein
MHRKRRNGKLKNEYEEVWINKKQNDKKAK